MAFYGINNYVYLSEHNVDVFLKDYCCCEQYHITKRKIGTEISEEIAVSFFRVSVAQNDKSFEEGDSNRLRKVGDYLPSDEGICISDDLNFFQHRYDNHKFRVYLLNYFISIDKGVTNSVIQ